MSRLARFIVALVGAGLFLAGAGLLIAGQSGALPDRVLGFDLDPDVPGVVVGLVGLFLLFRSGRTVKDDGADDDPEAHLTSIRDLRDAGDDRD